MTKDEFLTSIKQLENERKSQEKEYQAKRKKLKDDYIAANGEFKKGERVTCKWHNQVGTIEEFSVFRGEIYYKIYMPSGSYINAKMSDIISMSPENELQQMREYLTMKRKDLDDEEAKYFQEYCNRHKRFKDGDFVRSRTCSINGTVVSAFYSLQSFHLGINYTVQTIECGMMIYHESDLELDSNYSVTFELQERAKKVQEQVKKLEVAKKVSQETMQIEVDI